ncbi:MAG TPA: hypothetical protein VFG94_00135 [Acidimicrobiales bacterium]|nr:hypothetical protein [Acidimicrobiales bacterium]
MVLSGTAAQPQPGALRRGAGDPRVLTGLVFAASVALAAAVRVWQITGRGAVWWNDSAAFLTSAGTGLFSLDRWAGPRTAAAPLVLSLARFEPRTYVNWQAAIAVVCWGALATSVWTVAGGRRARWLGALAVVAFSCTAPVTMWERSVLSESLAVSTLALTLAAALQLARGVSGRRVAAVLAASALWLITRDSHASVVLVAALALGVGLVVAQWRARGRTASADGAKDRDRAVDALIVLAFGLFALGALAWAAASDGNRYAYPLRNVFEARVLPYPERVAWFAEHGMPQAERFVGPDAMAPIVGAGGDAPVIYVADHDPDLQEWLAWVERDGQGAFATWVATHPAYLVAEPLRNPERTFNNALGDRSFYAPIDQREVPLVTDVLVPNRWVALAVVAMVAAWATWRRRWRSPLLMVGAITVALAAPHGLVSWHSDGMETARHLAVPVLQLYLGALLMVLGVLTSQPEPDVASDA